MSLTDDELRARRDLFDRIRGALDQCFPERSGEMIQGLALLLEPTGMVRRGGDLFRVRRDEMRAEIGRALRFASMETAEEDLIRLDQWFAKPPRLRTRREIRTALPAGTPAEEVLELFGEPETRQAAESNRTVWSYRQPCVARDDLPAGFSMVLERDRVLVLRFPEETT